MKNNKILITGGAGYIGSHVVRQLGLAGEDLVTLDNLSTGFEAAISAGTFIAGDTGDAALLGRIFSEHKIDKVLSFAPASNGNEKLPPATPARTGQPRPSR